MTNTKMLYLRAHVVARGADDARPRIALLPIDDELLATLKAKCREIENMAPGAVVTVGGDHASWLGSERDGGSCILSGMEEEHGAQGDVHTAICIEARGLTLRGVTAGGTEIETYPLPWEWFWALVKRPERWVYQPQSFNADTVTGVRKAASDVHEALSAKSRPSERGLTDRVMARFFPKDVAGRLEIDGLSGVDEASRAVAARAEEAFWSTVAASFPTASTGDLDAGVAAGFEAASQRAVAAWIESNVPAAERATPTHGVPPGAANAISGFKVDGERRLFVRASADESGEMEEPEWAQIKIDQAFLDELAGYRRSMDAVNAFEIRAQGTPWAWRPDRSGEERYGESFDGEYIVCSPHGFHFVAHGERGGSINTREVSFAELERMLAEPHELMVQTDEPNGPRSSVLAELEEHFDNFDDGPSP